MNKNQKKSLYESIMKSVSKTVKRKLNEDIMNSSSFEEVITTLAQKIKRQEQNTFKDRLPKELYELVTENIAFIGDGSEYFISGDMLNCPYNNVDEIDQVYLNYYYDAGIDYGDEKMKRFLKKQLPKCLKEIQPMINDFDCEWKADNAMLFVNYKGKLNTIGDLRNAIIYLSKIAFQIDAYFADMFT